jgi:hypothetical protein
MITRPWRGWIGTLLVAAGLLANPPRPALASQVQAGQPDPGGPDADGVREPPAGHQIRCRVDSARGELAQLRVRLCAGLGVLPGQCGCSHGDGHRLVEGRHRPSASEPGLLARHERVAGRSRSNRRRLPRRGAVVRRAAERGRLGGHPGPALLDHRRTRRVRPASDAGWQFAVVLALRRRRLRVEPLGDVRRLQRALLALERHRQLGIPAELELLEIRRLPGADRGRLHGRPFRPDLHRDRYGGHRGGHPRNRCSATDPAGRTRLLQRPHRLAGEQTGRRPTGGVLPQLHGTTLFHRRLLEFHGRAGGRRRPGDHRRIR